MEVAVYGAPIWSLHAGTGIQVNKPLNHVQRTAAQRVAHTYQTVSRDAACVLANVHPS